MRAIKIDVIKKEIYEIDVDDSYQGMCKVLDSDGYDSIRIAKAEILWVDGDGLLRKSPLGAFIYHPYPNALSGHGLIMGIRGADSAPSQLTIEEVRSAVSFVELSELPVPIITMASFETMADLDEWMRNNRNENSR